MTNPAVVQHILQQCRTLPFFQSQMASEQKPKHVLKHVESTTLYLTNKEMQLALHSKINSASKSRISSLTRKKLYEASPAIKIASRVTALHKGNIYVSHQVIT